MTEEEQKNLGTTLWVIANRLRGQMNPDDFRDYMLSFLFLKYLSDNYVKAVQDELGPEYPTVLEESEEADHQPIPLQIWYDENTDDTEDFENIMRRRMHYVIMPQYLWDNIAELARTLNDDLLNIIQKSFKYIEEESFESTFQGLFSEINLESEKLGKDYKSRNSKLCEIVAEIAEKMPDFSRDQDTIGDAYEYLIGEFALVR